MASGILSLQPSHKALCLKPTSIQRKTGKDASELNPEARYENTWRNGGLVPRILNLALDQGVWSASRSMAVHSVSTGAGPHSRFGRSEKKNLLPTIEPRFLGCPAYSLFPIPTQLNFLWYSTIMIEGKTTFRVAADSRPSGSVCPCVEDVADSWLSQGSELNVCHHFLLYRHSQLLYCFVRLYCLSVAIASHLCYRCYTNPLLLQLW